MRGVNSFLPLSGTDHREISKLGGILKTVNIVAKYEKILTNRHNPEFFYRLRAIF